MQHTTIRTEARDMVAFFKANVAQAALPTIPAAQAADPFQARDANDTGVIELDAGNGCPGNFALLSFFGLGSNNTTCAPLILGWKRASSGSNPSQWVPLVLADLTVTLGSATGTSNGLTADTRPIASTYSMAKTIVVNSSVIIPAYDLIPARSNPPVQMIRLDVTGVQRLQLIVGPGSVTNLNGLVSFF